MRALTALQELLVGYMNLNENRIWAYNNDVNIPKDKGLYIVLEISKIKPIGNNIRYKTVDELFLQEQDLILDSEIIVHLISRDTSARENAFNLYLAFGSDLAQQTQEKYSCHISRISELQDRSFVEGDGNLTRFDIRVRVITGEMATSAVSYYDQFDPTDLSLIEQ